MNLHPDILAQLPKDLQVTFTCTVGELVDALSRAGELPEMPTTSELSKAWGFSARQWREWAMDGLIPGAAKDEGGTWRLPREAAREQFERALGRGIPAPPSTKHLPRAHGPRKTRKTGT